MDDEFIKNKYNYIEKLGKGSFGKVYLVERKIDKKIISIEKNYC